MNNPYWWETRREDESTASYLGRVLDEVGFKDMAEAARRYHYDDYLCPNDIPNAAFNIQRLVRDLRDKARSAIRDQRHKTYVVIDAAKDGEFDCTRQEAEAWAKSYEGQETFNELLYPNKRHSKGGE